MRSRRLVVLILCLLASSGFAEPPSQVEVDRLVVRLDDQTREVRDAAEDALIAFGPDVLPLLPEVNNNTAAEVKDRLARIRKSLEESSAEAVADASKITLSGSMTLSEALKSIQEQSGNRVVDYRERFGQQNEQNQITLEIKDQSFWQAIDQLCDQTGLTVYNFSGQARTLALTAAASNQQKRSGAASYSGLFRIEATEAMARKDLRTPNTDALRIQMEIQWEPRVIPILIRQPLSEVVVTADDGQPLNLISTDQTLEIPPQSTVSGIDIGIPLPLPDRSIKKIRSIKGTFYAMVPGNAATFTFDELDGARNVSQQKAGVTVSMDRVTQNRSVYEIRVRLKLDKASDSLQSHLDWASNNEAYLVHKDGTKIENPNFERFLERPNEIGFVYLFPLESIADYQFVYKSPAAILEYPVNFELKDIPLP